MIYTGDTIPAVRGGCMQIPTYFVNGKRDGLRCTGLFPVITRLSLRFENCVG